jgi:rhodanese-related sulfurtransferase
MYAKHLSPKDVLKINREDYFLIDTLPNDHFRKMHLPEAHNACVYEVSFLDQVKAQITDRNQYIIVYGSSGRSQDARVAAEKLQRAGFDHVAVLEGGIDAWKKAGYTLSGEAVDASDEPETIITLANGNYQLDLEKSFTEWTGRNQNNKHFGTLRFNKGSLLIDDGQITGTLEVDMQSIENINLAGDDLQPVLISHLKSDDFFFVNRFPNSVYKITEGRLTAKPYASSVNCLIQGELSLRDTTADLGFDATLTKPSENVLRLEAHFDVDRTHWGIIYGSARYFEHLGMHTVFDAISIELRCIFIMSRS